MSTEPAAIIGAITAAATAIIGLLVAFGIDFTSQQQAAILGVVAVVAPLVAAFVTRKFVWSPQSVDTEKREARADGYEKALNDVTPTVVSPQTN